MWLKVSFVAMDGTETVVLQRTLDTELVEAPVHADFVAGIAGKTGTWKFELVGTGATKIELDDIQLGGEREIIDSSGTNDDGVVFFSDDTDSTPDRPIFEPLDGESPLGGSGGSAPAPAPATTPTPYTKDIEYQFGVNRHVHRAEPGQPRHDGRRRRRAQLVPRVSARGRRRAGRG